MTVWFVKKIKKQTLYSLYFIIPTLLMPIGIIWKIDSLKILSGILVSSVYIFLALKNRKYIFIAPFIMFLYISIVKIYRQTFMIENYVFFFLVIGIFIYALATGKRSLKVW